VNQTIPTTQAAGSRIIRFGSGRLFATKATFLLANATLIPFAPDMAVRSLVTVSNKLAVAGLYEEASNGVNSHPHMPAAAFRYPHMKPKSPAARINVAAIVESIRQSAWVEGNRRARHYLAAGHSVPHKTAIRAEAADYAARGMYNRIAADAAIDGYSKGQAAAYCDARTPGPKAASMRSVVLTISARAA
jgi:hypothetical protein